MLKSKYTYVFLGGFASAFLCSYLYKRAKLALQTTNSQWNVKVGEARIL